MMIIDFTRYKMNGSYKNYLDVNYTNKKCPCYQDCLVLPVCSKACQKFLDFVTLQVSEIFKFLMDTLGHDKFYLEIECSQDISLTNVIDKMEELTKTKIFKNGVLLKKLESNITTFYFLITELDRKYKDCSMICMDIII